MKRLPFRKKEQEQTARVDAEAKLDDDIHGFIDGKLNIDRVTEVNLQSVTRAPEVEPVVDTSKNRVPVNYTEKMPRVNWNRMMLFMTVLGIMGIIFFTMYMEKSPAFLLLTWLFGMMCFLPLGLILGWLFLNSSVRVLVMRRMRGRNYGIVHFVNRGGQRMVTRIKNFDDDVIIQDTKMWILQNDGVYYLNDARERVLHAKIDSGHIKTMAAGIPVLYLDPDTMVPLTFHTVQSKSNPQQVGSTILGYIYNQIAKMLFMKKSLQIFFIIVIVLTGISLAALVQVAVWVDEIHKALPSLLDRINRLGELISEWEQMNSNATGLPDVWGGT